MGLALVLCLGGGCEERTRSLDGGSPLEFVEDPQIVNILAADPCARRERGGWHRSVGHCMEMTSAGTIEGVWVTAFEESSFFPGRRDRPDPRDQMRYTIEIELDSEEIFRRIGSRQGSPDGEAAYLRFVGRRTRDPYSVDCYGTPYFAFVVDRLIEARSLGAMEPFPPHWFADLRRSLGPPTVRRVHGGRLGELEAEAVEHCRGSGESGQRDGQASPPSNKSAE